MPDWPYSLQCSPLFLDIAYLLLNLSERLDIRRAFGKMMKYRYKMCIGIGSLHREHVKNTRNAHYDYLFLTWVPLHEERKRDVIMPGKLWNSTTYQSKSTAI